MDAGTIPWLAAARARLSLALAQERVPPALLLHDAPGAGGDVLARWTAQLLLCTAAQARPCGACGPCRGVALERHPDLLVLRPIEDSQQIRIEQVRELKEALGLASHQGGYKVVILDPADTLNRFAANALLKTLEEPTARTLMVLVAQQPSRLPATLLSRCQRLRIRPPAREQALAWLTHARGPGQWQTVLEVIGDAPLLAAALDPALVAQVRAETHSGLGDAAAGRGDLVALAERWSRSELHLRLACFENWLTERIRGRLVVSTYSAEMRGGAHTAAHDPESNARALFGLLDRLREFRAAIATPMNRSLALESLLRSLCS